MTTLHQKFQTEIRPQLATRLGIGNIHAAPKLQKIVVNIGLGALKGNEPLQKNVIAGLSTITGQKPISTHAKKAIAGFKIREKDLMGYYVTLRGQRMYDFLDRLITYVFPRLRDFQGMSLGGFDKSGNYTFGLREQTVFPEIPFQGSEGTWGLQITLVTTGKTKENAKALLEDLGFPFAKKKEA